MKINTRQVIEVVGLISVVASLLFVGMQLRLDRQVAIAGQYADRAESYKSDFRTQLESEAHMSALQEQWDRGERPPWWNSNLEDYVEDSGISGKEVQVAILNARLLYQHSDNQYFQYQQGFLDPDLWLSMRDTAISSTLQQPIWGDVFRASAEEGGIERPLDSVVRDLIAEAENK